MAETRTPEFVPAKLHVARAFRGLTQQELANKAALTQAFVSQLEKGHKAPSDDVLAAIAHALGFATSFFLEAGDDLFGEAECNFRRRKSTPAFVRERLVAQGNVFNVVVRYLDSALRLPKVAVPCLTSGATEQIERAADHTRVVWGVGLNLPCTNVVRAAERQGVVTTRFAGHAAQIDAFSRPGSRPLIVLNSDKGSTSRARWDVAHEVGHLVMHQNRPEGDEGREREADRFASSFLLPREAFCREFPVSRRIDWAAVFRLKARWKVSAAAIVRRAHDLDRIDAVEYRRAYKYMSMKGWLKGEPHEPPEEEPESVPLAFGVLYTRRGQSHGDVARQLGLTSSALRDVGIEPSEAELKNESSPPPGKVVPIRRTRSE